MKVNIVFVTLLTLSSCFIYRELPVEYDYSYRGNFNKYKTYDFLSDRELNVDDTLYIRSSIEQHMKFLGYRRKTNKPDLLLNYSIFDDKIIFRGYNQPDINEWIKKSDSDINYDKLNFDLNNGTLLIQVFDRKINASIWQGYTTDNYNKLNFYDHHEVKNAVKSILNKYQFFANGFIDEQLKKSKITN
jgi:hypothetical protein